MYLLFWSKQKKTFEKTDGSMENSNDVQHRIKETRGWAIMHENSCIFDIDRLFIYITNGVLLIMYGSAWIIELGSWIT